MNPASKTFYKKSAALRIGMIPPKIEMKGEYENTNPGTVLIEIAQSSGDRSYDWENKIIFALNDGETGEVFAEYIDKGEKIQAYHDPNKGTNKEGETSKSFALQPGRNGGHMVGLYQKNHGKENKAFIILSDAEFWVFCQLLKASIPYIFAWSAPAQQAVKPQATETKPADENNPPPPDDERFPF